VRSRQQFDSNNRPRAVHDVTTHHPHLVASIALQHSSIHQSYSSLFDTDHRFRCHSVRPTHVTCIPTSTSQQSAAAVVPKYSQRKLLADTFSRIFYELR